MTGDERIRLFCGLHLPGGAVERIGEWQARELRGGRVVPAHNLHITLAFLGSRPAGELPAIAECLRVAAGDAGPMQLRLTGYRETRSVAMLTFAEVDGRATALAARLHKGLEGLGVYRREARPWLPHVTVLRFQERPRLHPALPDLTDLMPSDAAVFISRLRPGGAEYESVETVALGG